MTPRERAERALRGLEHSPLARAGVIADVERELLQALLDGVQPKAQKDLEEGWPPSEKEPPQEPQG